MTCDNLYSSIVCAAFENEARRQRSKVLNRTLEDLVRDNIPAFEWFGHKVDKQGLKWTVYLVLLRALKTPDMNCQCITFVGRG
jgi:hypothetical protein